MKAVRVEFVIVLVVSLGVFGGCVPEENLQTDDKSPQLAPVIVPNDMVASLIDTSRIRYVPDPPGRDYWQSPEETQKRAQGDCEDICIFLQDRLKRQGIHVEVVFGVKTSLVRRGHSWCEYEQDGEVYIIEPFSGGFLRRKSLLPSMYIRAEDIDVVREKIKAYYERTGVYVNSAYRKLIDAEMEPAYPQSDRR